MLLHNRLAKVVRSAGGPGFLNAWWVGCVAKSTAGGVLQQCVELSSNDCSLVVYELLHGRPVLLRRRVQKSVSTSCLQKPSLCRKQMNVAIAGVSRVEHESAHARHATVTHSLRGCASDLCTL